MSIDLSKYKLEAEKAAFLDTLAVEWDKEYEANHGGGR